MYTIEILLAMAVLPGIVLMIYIYRKDKIEKEPIRLLMVLFFLGILACYPAGIIESFLEIPISWLGKGYLYSFVSAFFGVALVEEFCKYVFLRLVTWKSPYFNYRFDAIVYAVFVSLGFAVYENIMYVLEYGFRTAVVRAFISVPGHMMFAVFMGMYYGISKHAANNNNLSLQKSARYMTLFTPVAIHGFFDFCLFTGNPYFVIIFYLFVIVLYFAAFRNVKRFSANDYPIA